MSARAENILATLATPATGNVFISFPNYSIFYSLRALRRREITLFLVNVALLRDILNYGDSHASLGL